MTPSALSSIAWLGSGDPAVQATLRAAGALLFAAAAWHKLRDRKAFREALAGYRLLPAACLGPAAIALPCAELAAALALATPGSAAAGALAGAGLVALYAGAIGVNLARGRRTIDCGCGGPGGRRPIGAGLLWRNGALAAALLLAARTPSPRPFTWLDGASVAGCVASLALLYAALDVLLANRAHLGSVRARRSEPREARWATR